MAKKCFIAVEGASAEAHEELLTLIAETFGAEITQDSKLADIVLTDNPNEARKPFDDEKNVFVLELDLKGKVVDHDGSAPIKPRALIQIAKGSAYIWPAVRKAAATNGAAAAQPAASNAST